MPEFLPPGYRFRPTDEELITYYLQNKLQNTLEYNERFLDVDLYTANPNVFVGMHGDFERDQESWYFFTPRRYQNGTRPQRSAGDGFWKTIDADTPIIVNRVVVGYKRVLDFFVRGRKPNDIRRTEWKMHEYLTKDQKLRLNHLPDTSQKLNDCVLCKIYKNQRSRKRKDHPTNGDADDKYENVDQQIQVASIENTCQLVVQHQTEHQNMGRVVIEEHEYAAGQVLTEDQISEMIDDYLAAEHDAIRASNNLDSQ